MALFDEIEIFARVVEAGSITRAAHRLGLSKSRVSECVIALETRLGVRLLDRSTRCVAPTEAGSIFYARCARALEETQAGLAEMMARRTEPAGHLRIGAPDCFAELYVVPALASYLAACPGVTAEVVEDIRCADLVAQRLDLSIRISGALDAATIARRLGTSQAVICAAPGLLARTGRPGHPSELGGWPIAGFASLDGSRDCRFEAPEALSVPVRPVFVSSETRALRAAALAGIGLAAIPRWAILDDLAAGALEIVLGDWRLARRGIYAVYPSNRLISSKVRRFIDHLAPLVRAGPGAEADDPAAESGGMPQPAPGGRSPTASRQCRRQSDR